MVDALAAVLAGAVASEQDVWSCLKAKLKDEAARIGKLPLPKKRSVSEREPVLGGRFAPWIVAAGAAAIAAAAWLGRLPDKAEAHVDVEPRQEEHAILPDRPPPQVHASRSARAERERDIEPEPVVVEPAVARSQMTTDLASVARASGTRRRALEGTSGIVPAEAEQENSDVSTKPESESCSPPYYLDQRGIKRYQPECLSASR
jgi:hypothetical protein